MRHFLKTFLLFSLMFAPHEGFSSDISVEKLYHDSLRVEYTKLSALKESASKRKTAYIVSAVLALVLLGLFAYFFKLTGVIVALIMIGAGYFMLKSSKPVVGLYKEAYKEKIISPITKLHSDFKYSKGALSQEVVESSNLFSPSIKQFGSWDLYEKEGVRFSYIHVEFDTKENASVERMAENIFDGFLIMIETTNHQEGVLVSEGLRDKVAGMDLTMASFFAKGRRGGKRNGFDIYGEVSTEALDKASPLANRDIAISYQQDKTIIALYKKSNPFSVDVFKVFDLLQAQNYAKNIAEIDAVIQTIK